MALSGRVNDPPKPHVPGPRCGIGKLRDTLIADGMEEERLGLEELVQAVRVGRSISPLTSKQTWTAAAVHQILLDEGHAVSLLTVQRHIGKKCACGW